MEGRGERGHDSSEGREGREGDEVKFERPRLPGDVLERPRLVQMLAGADPPVTLVAAGPGYGKTVAVCQWLATEQATVAWVSLDRGDDAPRAFWAAVATSLVRATGEVGRDALRVLEDERDAARVPAVLGAELPRQGPPLIVVLDDLHVLRSGPVLEELALFVERLPPPVRLVATSRIDPRLPLGRWRASGRMAEIRQQDLQFTRDEAAQLFEARGLGAVGPDDVAFLAERTEGWPAGLQLAVLSLRDREDPHRYIRTALDTDRGIVSYLLGEVLESLDDGDRELILDLSVLDSFDAELAVAVTGRPDAAARIRALEAQHLLLLPADDQGRRFRFHQLLRECLLAELRWRSPGRDGALHAAAAAHLEAAGDHQGAAGHLVAAGDVDAAFRLIVDPAWVLLDGGQVAEARRRLDLLPPGVIGSDVDRRLDHLVLLTAAGRADEADRRAADLDADGAPDLTWLQEVRLAGLRSMLEYIRGDLVASQLSILRCIELLGDVELRGPVLDRVGGILVRHAIDERNLGAAAWWLEAMEDRQNESLVVRDLLPAALRARLALEQGRLADAERLARHVVDTAQLEGIGMVAPAGEARALLAEVLLEQGHLAEAEEHALGSAQDLAVRGLTVGEVRARLVAAEVACARFGPASALRSLDATRQAFEHRRTGSDVRWWLDAATCRMLLLDGDRAAASTILDRLPPSNPRRLLRARLALQNAAPDDVIGELACLEAPSEREQIEALALEAQAVGRPRSLELVREAAALADRTGFAHTFLREGPEVIRLARRADLEVQSPEIGRLLGRIAPARGPAGQAVFLEPLADRELTLLRLLPTHLTYREIAEEMCVSVNTVKTYQKALFRKLNAGKRAEAVAVALDAGLIEGAAAR